MKQVLLMIMMVSMAFASAFSTEINFSPGRIYRSEYNDQVGRAAVVMTGNPEYVLISADQNKCKDGICHLVGYSGELQSVLFRLHKLPQNGNLLQYEAVLVPLTRLGQKTYIDGYEESLSRLKVTIEVDTSDSNSQGNTGGNLMVPRTMILRVKEWNRERFYHLNKINSLRF